MADFIRLNWKYLLGAAALHVLFAGLFALTMIQMSLNAPPPQLAIQAVVVDATQVGATSRKREREREQERQRVQQEREQAAVEQKRIEEQRVVEQRAEQERQVEQQRRQEEEQKRAAEQQMMIERQDAERKRQAEVEQQKKLEAERQKKAEAERQRVAEIQRKQKEEAERRKAAEDARLQNARESELQRQLAEEEGLMQARSSTAFNEYVALIQDQIERNWNRPPSARPGLQCNIRVAQSPNGVVLSAQVEQCNGDAAVKQSIEQAVLRASPLPLPSDRRLFERNLILVFKPSE
ncbi:MAG TPA: cell envelope integrity protein TolA [Povalibacter sp.]|uniref:cell envelope integrity protein TolA n=1 Tax=Povalibacter sp. TaxID=1962978 RepID=UPI002C9B72CC|nr:cell envelope integrity protein TolA [Povalibacter sp.]HMN46243.1 cell envelope integrity protein TolA [Povalibacter sp.]